MNATLPRLHSDPRSPAMASPLPDMPVVRGAHLAANPQPQRREDKAGAFCPSIFGAPGVGGTRAQRIAAADAMRRWMFDPAADQLGALARRTKATNETEKAQVTTRPSRKLADFGPPKNASNPYVFKLLSDKCKMCHDCGQMTHYTGSKQPGVAAQAHVAGRVMSARRAMYMAAHQKRILKGRRITSRCVNPECINPELLHQATAGQILKADYVKGTRSRAAAAAHLQRFRKVTLSADAVRAIMADERGGKAGAADYGISDVHFNAIKRGQSRRVGNPFAGLLS